MKTIGEQTESPNSEAAFLIFGKEIGKQGTPHLQGFVSFRSRKRLNQVINLLGQCHCSIAKYISESIEYCKKEKDYFEFGEKPKGRGNRSDLSSFMNAVREGLKDLKEVRNTFPEVYAKYPRFCIEYIKDHEDTPTVQDHPLREWQKNLNEKLKGPIDSREIIFLVDIKGNSGKSWFFRYYTTLHKKNSQIILPCKKQDMAFLLRNDNRVVFFDCPRSKQGEFIQYDFLEEIKNGIVISPKYESMMKTFTCPHVVVAMNEYPNMEMLSADRYHVITLDETS